MRLGSSLTRLPREREQRLDAGHRRLSRGRRAGQPPDRSDFLAIHSDLADDLLSFFADEDRLRGPGRRDSYLGDTTTARLDPRADAEIEPGTDFGEYELIEEIASGGMGIVFKARQKKLDRIVALKTIRPAALRPGADAIQRFRIEAEAVARLDHPHIVPIYEMGEYGGFPFLSLKLIMGRRSRTARLTAQGRSASHRAADERGCSGRPSMHTCAGSCTAT